MKIRPWQARERLESKRLNEVVTAVNSGLPVTGGTGLRTFQGTNGTVVALEKGQYGWLNILVGKVALKGPKNEGDFTDYRYWIMIQENISTLATLQPNQTLDLQDHPDGGVEGLPRTVAAINLYEYVDQTHNLKENDEVMLIPIRIDKPNDPNIAPITRYLCVPGSGNLSKGQFQYQSYTMVSQNQAGWEFVRCHPTI